MLIKCLDPRKAFWRAVVMFYRQYVYCPTNSIKASVDISSTEGQTRTGNN